MKAMMITANGGPEVLTLREVPVPVIGMGRLLVKVQAAAVNPIDCKLRKTGAFGFGPASILGFDVSGIIEQMGPDVTDFAVGDAVYYSPDFSGPGGYAQYHLVQASLAAPKPLKLSFIDAAALPLAGQMAWDGIVERGQVRLGDTVLIHGASGGVGSLAVQLAHTAGAYVFATCSAANAGLVRSLGADYVIDRSTEDFAQIIREQTHGRGVDMVYDCFGGDLVVRSLPIVRPFGRIITIVNPSGDLSVGYRRNVSLHYLFLQRSRRTLDALSNLVERGQIKPVISRVLPLEQAADAHRQLEAGGGFGKIVLTVG